MVPTLSTYILYTSYSGMYHFTIMIFRSYVSITGFLS